MLGRGSSGLGMIDCNKNWLHPPNITTVKRVFIAVLSQRGWVYHMRAGRNQMCYLFILFFLFFFFSISSQSLAIMA